MTADWQHAGHATSRRRWLHVSPLDSYAGCQGLSLGVRVLCIVDLITTILAHSIGVSRFQSFLTPCLPPTIYKLGAIAAQRDLVRNTASIVVIAASLMTLGCQVGEVTDSIAQPNLVILDDATASRLTVEQDGLFVATADAGTLAQVHEGDVILSNGSEPFLRKVLSVTAASGQLAILTEPAALTDAILQGHVQSHRDLLSEPVPQEPGQTAVIIPVDKLALDFGATKLIDQGGIKVNINQGTVTFRPVLDVDLQIDDGSLTSFHAILQGDLEASMGITISTEQSFNRSFSTTLWESPRYVATQFIGAIPVVEVVTISLVLSGEVHAGASGTIDLGSAKAKASLKAGATYQDGEWSAIADPSINFEARGPSLAASTSAGASMRLTTRVDVKFYDVAGPHLIVGAYAKTDLSDSLANGLHWTGRVGMDASFGGDLTVLGKNLATYNRGLFDLGRDFTW